MSASSINGGAPSELPDDNPVLPESLTRLNLLERLSLALACVCCVTIAVLSLLDTVFRPLHIEFHFAGETSRLLLAWMMFMALPAVTRRRAHINLAFFDDIVPPQVAKVVRIFGYVVMIAYVAILGWFLGRMALTSIAQDLRSPSILRFPIIYSQAGVIVGMSLMVVTQILVLFRDMLTPALPTRATISSTDNGDGTKTK